MSYKAEFWTKLCFREVLRPKHGAGRSFGTTPTQHASTVAQKRRHHDPYAINQMRAKRAANLSRQEVLQEERAKMRGHPVRGLETPFLRSFDSATDITPEQTSSDIDPQTEDAQSSRYLNHFVSSEQMERSLEHSEFLTQPSSVVPDDVDPERVAKEATLHRERHDTAKEAIKRILAVENAGRQDKLRINTQRCIETFGRHNTDSNLRPRPSLTLETKPSAIVLPEKTPRAGPDTGSSEVQIAILTAKIRGLAHFLDTRGKNDKVNKRNLRLLVHKRQKLLKYLNKKEKGGERWQNLVETLGLTEGTWRSEISL